MSTIIHDLCCMCENHYEMHKSEVDPYPWEIAEREPEKHLALCLLGPLSANFTDQN